MEIKTFEELKKVITKDNAEELCYRISDWIITQASIKEIIKKEKRLKKLKEEKTFTFTPNSNK